MKIVVVGYGEMFRALITGILKTQNEIVGVFRHENVIYSPIDKKYNDIFKPSGDCNFVKLHKLPEIQAKSVNSAEFIKAVQDLEADIIITGSWSEKFSAQTINSPKIACINVHPSLLPKYRGPNPYLQVILHNEAKTGITFHLMDINYDTGSVLHQAEVEIQQNDTGQSLKDKCCALATKEVQVLLNNLPKKIKNQQSQDEKQATYYHHISVQESVLDFEKETAEETDRRIRALSPWLKCHIAYKNDFFEFDEYKICKEKSKKEPATIVKKTKKSILVVCKGGRLMKFTSLKAKRPLGRIFSGYYFKKIIKENEKAI